MSERDIPLTADVEDILPIIKRFVYAEREVFLRELLSNSVDALAKLGAIGRTESAVVDDGEPPHIEVSLDPLRGTLTVADNGGGMTSDEVVRYINKIAFSGAREFLDKYAHSEHPMIGQFGLGFYSCFMVSKRVEIETRSWAPGATGCRWSCDGGSITRIGEIGRERRGTSVICHLEEEAREFLDRDRVEQVIVRFLDYAPYPIFLTGRQVNVVTAPWHLNSAEREGLPEERYCSFYERLNPNENRPLAWFHVESDYPIEAHALLFVPDRSPGVSGNVRIFANRTFISDRCAELLPKWLNFLDGVVDSPDLPLNVARDRFQQDRKVSLLRHHLATKTVRFLAEMLAKRRRDYVKLWERYGSHLKYGYLDCLMEDRKAVSDKLEKLLVFPSSRKPLTTVDEYLERTPEAPKSTILYLTDAHSQRAHLDLLRNCNREVLFFTDRVDLALLRALSGARPDWSFVRIDQIGASAESQTLRDPTSSLTEEISWEALVDLFRELAGQSVNKVSVEALPSRDLPALLNVTEAGAMQDDLRRLMGSDAADEHSWTLVINSNSPLIQAIGRLGVQVRSGEISRALVGQIWDNVRLSAGLLEGDRLADAVRRGSDFLTVVAAELANQAGRKQK